MSDDVDGGVVGGEAGRDIVNLWQRGMYRLLFFGSAARLALRAGARRLESLMLEFTVALLIAGGLLVWWQWTWVAEDASGSEVARNMVLASAAVVALPLAIWRSRVAEMQADTAHRAMLHQRFQQALEMAGSKEGALQVSGIHSLRRLAEEYPEAYEEQVAEVFDALARFPIGVEQSDDD